MQEEFANTSSFTFQIYENKVGAAPCKTTIVIDKTSIVAHR